VSGGLGAGVTVCVANFAHLSLGVQEVFDNTICASVEGCAFRASGRARLAHVIFSVESIGASRQTLTQMQEISSRAFGASDVSS
jgi:hypothetical protein